MSASGDGPNDITVCRQKIKKKWALRVIVNADLPPRCHQVHDAADVFSIALIEHHILVLALDNKCKYRRELPTVVCQHFRALGDSIHVASNSVPQFIYHYLLFLFYYSISKQSH